MLAPTDLTGQVLKSYHIRERIGRGGFGSIYRAEQPAVGREVAVKVILPEYANQPAFIRRFEAEAQLVARLEHPFIVPLYDYWRDPSGAYLVMRYLRGGSLQQSLTIGPWSLPDAARLLDQISAALMTAHRSRVVHRDLKPENILLDREGNAYLTDFGIAKDLAQEDRNSTQAGQLVGSPAYLSPEQVRGDEVTPQSDIYTVGILLYEMLTGQQPFPAATMSSLLLLHLQEPIPSVTDTRDDVPRAVDAVIQRATAKEPAERYSSALALAASFRRAAGLEERSTSISTGDGITIVRDVPAEGREVASTPTAVEMPEPDNPYKGLRAFEEADSEEFFGRDALVNQLLDHLKDEDQASFLALVGPSGSGKSSAIKAGLIPRLRRAALPHSDKWYIVEMVPGSHPLEEIEAALLRIAVNPPETLLAQIKEDKRGLVRALKRVLPEDERVELVLYIDQFEEVFTQVEDEARREHFLAVLAEAARDPRSRLRVIVTLRADFYDRPLLYQGFGELVRDYTEVVLPLSSDELRAVIVQPAEKVGVAIEEGLVEDIVADVYEQPGVLPLLQYALTELFERREGRVLTREAYHESGGVRGALARRAEELYMALHGAGQIAARQVFLRLVTLGEGTDDTRRRALRSELTSIGPEVGAVIDTFGRSRLLTFDHDSETREPTVEVAHEALIRQWSRLREWLDQNRDDVRQQRRLAATAAEWLAADRDPSFLASGSRLTQLEEWAAATDLVLNANEEAFIQASVEQRAARETAEAERQAREDTLEARSRNRLRALVGVMGVALVAMVILAATVYFSQQTARRQATVNQSLTLATGAQLALSDNDTDRAIVLALAANEVTDPPTQAQRSLAEAALAPGTRDIYTGHEGIVNTVDFSALGSRFLSGGTDGRIILWNRRSGDAIRSFAGHEGAINALVFSPDGTTFASASGDNTVITWQVETGVRISQFTGHSDAVRDVAYSPDGGRLVTASADGTAIIWDTDTQAVLHTLTGHEGTVNAAAFTPDGRFVLTGGDDTIARLWDAETGELVGTFEGHAGRINDLAISPDGSLLATAAGSDNAVFLWDVESAALLRRLIGHADQPYAVTFSPDNELVVSASQDGTIRLWDVQTGSERQRLQGHMGGVTAIAFDPDGLRLLSGSQDATLRVWDINNGAELVRFNEHNTPLYDVAISPDETLAATAAWDHTVLLWDPQTGQVVGRLGAIDNQDPAVGHTDWLTEVAFMPNGTQLVSSSYDGTLILWDVETRSIIRRYEGHERRIWSFAISPDGLYLATASQDGTLRYWDAETGETLWTGDLHDGPVRGIAISPDGQTVLSGSGGDQTVRLWDADTGQQILLLAGHQEWLWHTDYSPNGAFGFSSASDGVILMWDLETGDIVRSFEGHDGPVVDFAITPDGTRLVSGSSDTTIRVWDIASGRELRRFSGHRSTVWGVVLMADGSMLLSGSGDSTARVWDIDFTLEELREWVRLNRYVAGLTCADRAEYAIEPLCEE